MTQWVRTLAPKFDDLRQISSSNSVDEENRCLSIISSWTGNIIFLNLIMHTTFQGNTC